MLNFIENKKVFVPFAKDQPQGLRIGSQLTIIMAQENCGVCSALDVISSKLDVEQKKMSTSLNGLLNT